MRNDFTFWTCRHSRLLPWRPTARRRRGRTRCSTRLRLKECPQNGSRDGKESTQSRCPRCPSLYPPPRWRCVRAEAAARSAVGSLQLSRASLWRVGPVSRPRRRCSPPCRWWKCATTSASKLWCRGCVGVARGALLEPRRGPTRGVSATPAAAASSKRRPACRGGHRARARRDFAPSGPGGEEEHLWPASFGSHHSLLCNAARPFGALPPAASARSGSPARARFLACAACARFPASSAALALRVQTTTQRRPARRAASRMGLF